MRTSSTPSERSPDKEYDGPNEVSAEVAHA